MLFQNISQDVGRRCTPPCPEDCVPNPGWPPWLPPGAVVGCPATASYWPYTHPSWQGSCRRKEAGLLAQGAVGLTLPLPLNTIKGLVTLLKGKARNEEVKEAVDILGMGVQEECNSLVTGATLEEELLSYWENDLENVVRSKEDTQIANKSLDNSEDRENTTY